MSAVRVLVTGGYSGLGLATCKYFLSKGALVASMDSNLSDKSEIKPQLSLKADVTNESEVKKAMESIHHEFKGLDLLVNCAGISCAYLTYNHHKQRIHSLDDFQRMLQVNTLGTFNVIRLACSLLAKKDVSDERSSVIVTTSSISSFDGQIGQVAYAASKGAIASMTLPLARELSNVNIRVCSIAPGPMETPMLQVLPPKAISILSKMIPLPKRLGKPEEFAKLVDCIYNNQYLNGEIIRLDGALRMQP